MSITNYELQITNLRRKIFRLAFLCVCFASLAIKFSFAQTTAQPDFEFLANKINHGATEQKRDALFQIRNLATPEASRIAIPALSDKAEIVRATAAYSVIFLPADEAARNLLPLLNDKKELVRREAAYALGKTRSPLAADALVQRFQKEKSGDVKNACVVALGETGDVSAVDFLTRLLQKAPKKDDDADEFLRRGAARSIGQIAQIIQTGKIKVSTPEDFLSAGSKEITPPNYKNLAVNFPVFRSALNILIQTLQNRKEADDPKREAAFALGAIGDESATRILQSKLNGDDYYLAAISRESLRKIAAVNNY